ncbi:MAG: hypothetical protein WCV50_01210 [Patescibacteria group bacterium]|jgi:hypothetical protein
MSTKKILIFAICLLILVILPLSVSAQLHNINLEDNSFPPLTTSDGGPKPLGIYIQWYAGLIGILAFLGIIVAIVEMVVIATQSKLISKQPPNANPENIKIQVEKLHKRIIFWRWVLIICAGILILSGFVYAIIEFRACCSGSVTT